MTTLPDVDATSDAMLLARIRSGDAVALATVYRRHGAAVYRFAHLHAGSPSTAADATQETFLWLTRDGAAAAAAGAGSRRSVDEPRRQHACRALRGTGPARYPFQSTLNSNEVLAMKPMLQLTKFASPLVASLLLASHAALAANVDVEEIRDTIRKAMVEAHVSGNTVYEPLWTDDAAKGNPYSAREVREFKQTLGDGTVIWRQSTRLLTRDREGRTRQELRQPDGTARVFINDPVAKEAIILDPQKKLACRAPFVERAIYDCFEQTRGDWKPTGFAFTASRKGISMLRSQEDIAVNVAPDAFIVDFTQGPFPRREIIKRQPADGESAVPLPPLPPLPPLTPPASHQSSAGSAGETQINRQKKTQQPYEGLRVDTDRTVETINAGTIGNSKAIESVYERYYSPELKMNVYVRRSDPRSGESLYRMTDIKRSEPDAQLFRAPTGYAMSEGKK